MTVYLELECPTCGESKSIVKFGHASNNKQRYCCQNDDCSRKTFICKYDHRGRLASVKKQIIDMVMNGSGTRDIARVLGISRETVAVEIKKKRTRFRQLIPMFYREMNNPTYQLTLYVLMKLKPMRCGVS